MVTSADVSCRDSYSWWGPTGGQIPDLDEITKFSVQAADVAQSNTYNPSYRA
jgi:hypothetical protein